MRFTRDDRKAVIVILALLLLLNVGIFMVKKCGNKPVVSVPQADSIIVAQTDDTISAQLFTFDPNTADSATFVRLGLPPRVARAIVHYREAGGRFRVPQDFARIYTLSDADYQRLLPYIYIKDNDNRQEYNIYERAQQPDTPSRIHGNTAISRNRGEEPRYYKLHQGQTVDIATADTTELKRIPGIGSYYASKIVRYRTRLGGFISSNQLAEIQGLPEDIIQWVVLSRQKINKLPVNSATFGQLLRHPYLNFEQVSAIMNYRKAFGSLSSLNDLKTYPAFSDADLARLEPYLGFD